MHHSLILFDRNSVESLIKSLFLHNKQKGKSSFKFDECQSQIPQSLSSAALFCPCPFALQHSVTATKTANRQCQWPCSHTESASTHGNSRHTMCPEPGQREIRKGSKGPRHKGPAACRALALHRGKQGLLITPHACDPSFYSVVVPNGKNQRWKQELSAKYILRKTITARIITHALKYHMRLVCSDHNQTTSESYVSFTHWVLFGKSKPCLLTFQTLPLQLRVLSESIPKPSPAPSCPK